MSADLHEKLDRAAGTPRFELPLDLLYRRARRARTRVFVARAAGGIAVVTATVLVAASLMPSGGPGPVVAPGPSPTATVEPSPAGQLHPLFEEGRWVINGSEGLQRDDWRVLWETDWIPAAGVARDGVGGLVFTDAAGLWWWREGALEPDLVRPGDHWILGTMIHPELGPVVHSYEDQIVLETGDVRTGIGAPPGLRTPAGPSITAANGLTARVIEHEAMLTPEGTIERVTRHATLVIERGDEALVSVVVGTDFEPMVTLRDFDGRHVLLTRTLEEPAWAPESLLLLDLNCPSCVEVHGWFHPVGASLVGHDVRWAGPVQAPRADLVTPMVTDEGVTELPDGRHLLWEVEVGDGAISGDLVIWFPQPVADLAAAEDGETDLPVPNDYHLRNRDPARVRVPVAADVAVTSAWYHSQDGGVIGNRQITYTQWLAAMRGEHDDARDNLRTGLWWVQIEGGVIVQLDEQYVP